MRNQFSNDKIFYIWLAIAGITAWAANIAGIIGTTAYLGIIVELISFCLKTLKRRIAETWDPEKLTKEIKDLIDKAILTFQLLGLLLIAFEILEYFLKH